MRMGLERAGWRMAFANDIDEDRHHHSACLPVAEPVVPPNTTATIDVTPSDGSSVMEGGKTIETSGGIKFLILGIPALLMKSVQATTSLKPNLR